MSDHTQWVLPMSQNFLFLVLLFGLFSPCTMQNIWCLTKKVGFKTPLILMTIPGNNNISFPFPKVGNGFFIPIPVPNSWEYNFSFPFPFPKVGNAILHSRSFLGNGSGIRSGITTKVGTKIDIIHLRSQLSFEILKKKNFIIST